MILLLPTTTKGHRGVACQLWGLVRRPGTSGPKSELRTPASLSLSLSLSRTAEAAGAKAPTAERDLELVSKGAPLEARLFRKEEEASVRW